ncbi:MAG: hypothetical protein IIX70_02535, partial [Oscillospiraceae bacterium]|nr:hypothetical protein [Oscillospiraceae bacterium]
LPVHVEVVNIDPDYEDYEQLEAYKNELYEDPAFFECDYTSCHFDLENKLPAQVCKTCNDEILQDGQKPVRVIVVNGNAEFGILFSGTWDQCEQYCKENNWSFWDEDNQRWDIGIEDPLELSLPEGFFLAVDHFSNILGTDIHNGFVRQHAEELVFCHKNNIDYSDFDFWTRYETLLGKKISFGEYSAIERHFHGDPIDIAPHDTATIHKLKGYLEGFRCERKAVLSLDEQIIKADGRRLSQQQTTAPERNTEQQR